MNIVPQLRKNIRTLFKEEKFLVIAFVILPIVITFICGAMTKDSFEGKSSIEPVNVKLIYDEESELGAILSSDLKRDQIKSFMKVDEKNPECEVTISDDFKDVQINNISSTDARINIIKKFFENFTSNVKQYNLIYEKINDLQVNEQEKGKILEEFSEKFEEIQIASSIEENLIEGYKTLNSYEYYSISTFSFTSMILIFMFINKYFDERGQGVIKRTFAAPTRKEEYIVGYALSASLTALLINSLYVVINIFLNTGFKQNFLGIIIALIGQSLMQGTFAGVIVTFIKNKSIVNSIMSMIVILPVIAGGAFFKIDSLEDGASKILGNFSPNSLILNSYKTLAISSNINDSIIYIILMFILSLVFFSISIIKVKKAWEV